MPKHPPGDGDGGGGGGGGTQPPPAAIAEERQRLKGDLALAEERVQVQGADATIYGPLPLYVAGSLVKSISVNAEERRIEIVLGLPNSQLAASWDLDVTLTSIGTSFVNVYPGTGKPVEVDFTGTTQVGAIVNWNKNGGAGTHSVQVVNADNPTDVLFSLDVVTGSNVFAFAALPSWAVGTKKILVMAKSTTGADSPIFEGASVRIK